MKTDDGGLPISWKPILLTVSAVGTFIGAIFLPFIGRHGDKETLGISASLERMTRIEKKIEDLTDAVGTIADENSDIKSQFLDMRRSLARVEKAVALQNASQRSDEMHSEIMDILREFQAKGVKRR